MFARPGGLLSNHLKGKLAKIHERITTALRVSWSRCIASLQSLMAEDGFSIATVKQSLSRLPVETVRFLGIVVGVASVGLTSLIWIGQVGRIDWRATLAFGSLLAFLVGLAALSRVARTSGLCKTFLADRPFAKVWAGIKSEKWRSASRALKDGSIANLRGLKASPAEWRP